MVIVVDSLYIYIYAGMGCGYPRLLFSKYLYWSLMFGLIFLVEGCAVFGPASYDTQNTQQSFNVTS